MINWLHRDIEPSDQRGQFASCGRGTALRMLRGNMNITSLADCMTYVSEISQLHHAEWERMDRSLTLESRTDALKAAAGKEGIPSVFVATNGNEFVGSAALVEQDLDTHKDLGPWLSAVFVKESWRNQGVASLLVERCEAEAKKAGVGKIYLSTEFASGLYKKLGWEFVERCVYRGVELDVMCREFTS